MLSVIFMLAALNVTGIAGVGSEWGGRSCLPTHEWLKSITNEDNANFRIEACRDLDELVSRLVIPAEFPYHWAGTIGEVPADIDIDCLEPCEDVGFSRPCRTRFVLGLRLGDITSQEVKEIATTTQKLGCDFTGRLTSEWQRSVIIQWSEFHTNLIILRMWKMLQNIHSHKLKKDVFEDGPTNGGSPYVNVVSEDRPRSILDDYDIQDIPSYEELNQRFINIFGVGLQVNKVRYDSLTKEIRSAYQKEIEWRIRHMPVVFSENETPELYQEALLRVCGPVDLSGAQYYTRMVYGRTAVKVLTGLRRSAFLWPISKDMADKIRHLAEKYGFTLEEIGTDDAELDRLSEESPFKGDTIYRWE